MDDVEARLRADPGGGPPGPPPLRTPDGLLDVAYVAEPSPLGDLLLAATPRGLVRVAYLDAGPEAGDGEARILAELAARVSPRILRSAPRLDPIRRQLDAFFAGELRGFEVPLDWTLVRGFAQQVLRATAAIPFGQVSSYGDVAAAAGSPRAFRAAGTALGRNPLPIVVPCHRILHAGGGIGGYTGGLERKRLLLRIEGALPPA